MFFSEIDPVFELFFFSAFSLILQEIEACKQSETQSFNRFHDVGHSAGAIRGTGILKGPCVVEGDSSFRFLPTDIVSLISSTIHAQKGVSIKMDKPREKSLSCRGKGPYTEIDSIYLTEFSETFWWRRFLELRVHHASSDDGNENDRVFLLFP
jgi:hypothetical protein